MEFLQSTIINISSELKITRSTAFDLRLSVNFVVPLKVGRDGQLHSQCRPRDRLHMNRKLQLRQLVHVLVDCLAALRHAHQLANLVRVQVVEPFPRKVLLLDLAHHLLWDLLELTQWTHRLPPASSTRPSASTNTIHVPFRAINSRCRKSQIPPMGVVLSPVLVQPYATAFQNISETHHYLFMVLGHILRHSGLLVIIPATL